MNVALASARRAVARARVVTAWLGLLLVIVAAASLALGDVAIAPADVLRALVGAGSPYDSLVVREFRLPRVLTALAVGGALGASGAIFQSLTRNPLGSPDIVGFTAGSAMGAVVALIVFGGGTFAVASGALVGGLLCALTVLALAARGGVSTGPRFVLIGIGVAAMLTAANGYLITRASLGDATSAQAWIVGSLNARGWETAVPLLLALAVLLPCAVLGRRALLVMELGDDAAGALGIDIPRVRTALVVCGIALCAAGTAAAGPVAFVALAAPQVARRLLPSAGAPVVTGALVGAVLLAAADLAAQRVLAPVVLPVGVVTGLVGGVYLGWLLWNSRRKGGV